MFHYFRLKVKISLTTNIQKIKKEKAHAFQKLNNVRNEMLKVKNVQMPD